MSKGLCNVSGISAEELINFLVFYNGTKYAVDKFIYAERTQFGAYNISHSLGESPLGVVIFTTQQEDGVTDSLAFLMSASSDITTGSREGSIYYLIDYDDLGKVLECLSPEFCSIGTDAELVYISQLSPSINIYCEAGIEYTLITIA